MHDQFSEPPAESLLLLDRDVLVSKEDHLVCSERVLDLLDGEVVQRLGEVHAFDFRPDDRGERTDGEAGGHFGLSGEHHGNRLADMGGRIDVLPLGHLS